MLKPSPELLLSEIKRMQRLHRHEDLPGILTDYITERYYPKTMATSRKRKRGRLTFERISNKVLEYYGAKWEDIVRKTRKKEVVAVRRVIMYLLAVRTKMSMVSIGQLFAKDHTTVIHNRDRLIELMQLDGELRLEIEFLNSQL